MADLQILPKVCFIYRAPGRFVSIENVFNEVEARISNLGFGTAVSFLKFSSTILGIIGNLLSYRVPDADLYHVTGDCHYICLRLPKRKTILTIHDLRFLNHNKGIRRWLLKKLFLDWPIARVSLITVPSFETKRHLQEVTGIADDRVEVVMNPLAETYITPSERTDSVPEKILMFGGMANKNLPNSLAAIRDYGITVVTAGPLENASLRALETGKRDGFDWLRKEPKDAAEMRQVYLEADVLLFCSTFEGFGLPIIEAQACGTLVVTSNRAPMNEISGDGAVLVNPESTESIREAVGKILSDPGLRATLRKEGFRNIERFRPNSTSERFAEFYSLLISGGGISKG